MRPTRVLAVTALAAVLTLSACSSGSDDMDSGGTTSAGDVPAAAPEEAPDAANDSVERGLADGTSAFDAQSAADKPDQDPDAMERAIITKGNVQLQSNDVEKAVFNVQALVDKAGGEITDRETNTDDEGEIRLARLVLRIPAKLYSDAFAALEQIEGADLTSSSSTSEDVTTQIIDIDSRIRAQRASLERVEVLLGQATSIRDIVAIESQLTRRQADLDSMVKRLAFLRDQTSMSTVTVNIQRTADEPKKKDKKDDDESGFFSGLEDGWNALTSFGTGLSTVAGAVLPWSIALLILGGLCWPFLRRLRGRVPTRPARPATPGPTDA